MGFSGSGSGVVSGSLHTSESDEPHDTMRGSGNVTLLLSVSGNSVGNRSSTLHSLSTGLSCVLFTLCTEFFVSVMITWCLSTVSAKKHDRSFKH